MFKPWVRNGSRLVVFLVALVLLAQTPMGVMSQGIKDVESTEEATPGESGLTGPTTYESPTLGYSVEWEGPWVADPAQTTTYEPDEIDKLALDGGRDTEIFIYGFAEGKGGPPEDIAEWTSDEFMNADPYALFDEIEILIEEPGSDTRDGAVLLALVSVREPHTYVLYMQSVAMDDGSAMYVLLQAPLDRYAEALEDARNLVTIDGDASFDVFTNGEVDDALDGATVIEQSDEQAGMEDDREYVAPVYGYELEWPRKWELDPSFEDLAATSSEYYASDELNLASMESPAQASSQFFAWGDRPYDTTIEAELADLVDPGIRAGEWGGDVEVEFLLETSSDEQAASLAAITFPNGVVVYEWVRFSISEDGDYFLTLSIRATPDYFEQEWEAFSEGFLLDGEPIDTMFSQDEIEEATAEFEAVGG